MADDTPRLLPLHERHVALGARFAPFAGFSMPMRYGSILEEHEATRTRAGLFDVSHMGEVFVRGPGAIAAVQQLVTNDVGGLDVGRALYTVMCQPDGGIVDDLIVYRLGEDELMLCVNAANRDGDVAWIREVIGDAAAVEDESDAWAQLAIQGPRAREIALACMDTDLAELASFGVARARMAGVDTIVARTGYTGEDGFELYLPVDGAAAVFDALMASGAPHGLVPVGLGARDTLRLEARLLLYGSDIDRQTNPIEAGLGWVVKLDKGPFVGAEALRAIRAEGPRRRLRGFILREKGVLRGGQRLLDGDREVGTLTSGSVAPSLDGVSIGLGYVDRDAADAEQLSVEMRGRVLPVEVTRRPFYRRAD